MSDHQEYQYLNLLRSILLSGKDSDDRTGVGTRRIFGAQMRFDLSKEFPLFTTKKVHWKSIVGELLWMISGSTDNEYLKNRGISIWEEWKDENGNFGPIYGHQLRNHGGKYKNVAKPIPKPAQTPTVYGVGYLEDLELPKKEPILYRKWKSMLKRCYYAKDENYSYYGAKGVHVVNEWLSLKTFIEDAKQLDGFDPSKKLELDKDFVGNGFVYGPKTCCWLSQKENKTAAQCYRTFTVKNKEGQEFTFTNGSEFRKIHGIKNQGNFNSMLRGERNVAEGFVLVSSKDNRRGVDQLQNVIQEIKKNPNSRRLVMTLWNPADLPYQALPCCHGTAIQFGVIDGRLNCHMFQRSGDCFLGVPFNVASYSLLTLMIAHVTGLQPGEFVHSITDAHIYKNHFDQVKEQLSREPKKLPTVSFRREILSIDNFRVEDIILTGYESHPGIKAPVAV